jgi:putative methyltransferase (TIGR04325 family)
MKNLIKRIIPPIFLDALKKLKKSKYGWHGNYSSWDEAKKESTGYDTDEILTKVRNSLLKVKNGEAVYERDSVIFDKIEYSWPLVSGLMFAAVKSGGILNVLDFGGSLGSTFFQNKNILDNLSDVSWNIVEQKKFVEVGKKDFEDKYLHFYYDVKSCQEEQNPNTLVLSSVLQYIEEPYTLLDDILKYDFDYILIDRTPFSTQKKDKIKLQIVPPIIYEASYPCHFFDQDYFERYFVSKQYKLIEKFDALDGSGTDYKFEGMILKKDYNV